MVSRERATNAYDNSRESRGNLSNLGQRNFQEMKKNYVGSVRSEPPQRDYSLNCNFHQYDPTKFSEKC